MNIPTLKLISGREIPKLGLGTWGIGGGPTKDPSNDDKGQIESIRYAIDNGITLIRTAHNYAEGYTEELVGQAIKGYDREKLFLISCANQKTAIDKESIIEVAKNSLKALDIDYFDIYLIGAINPDYPIKPILDGLLQLQEEGLTKEIGVSNYRLPELKAATEYLGNKLTYSEMHYNLTIREPEIGGTLDYCREKGIVLSAYRPLQLGQLSKPGILLLDEIVKKYGKSQSQIALKWLVQKDGVITMTKAEKKEHIDQDLDIFSWELEKEDMDRLNKDFPIQIRISDCSEPRQFKFE
jgi:diketogulonate reductase-like aldo/keto reductase